MRNAVGGGVRGGGQGQNGWGAGRGGKSEWE